MFNWHNIYLKLLTLIIKFFIRTKIIPTNLHSIINTEHYKHIIYVMPSNNSQLELLTLRLQCLHCGLPDPIKPLQVNNIFKLPRYIFVPKECELKSKYIKKSSSATSFYKYLMLQFTNSALDIQIILVSVMFGRSPGKEKQTYYQTSKKRLLNFNYLYKLKIIFWLGRDSFIHFSHPLSMKHITKQYIIDQNLIRKFARIARIYFIRQQLIIIGPRLPIQQDLLKKLLKSPIIKKAIQDEVKIKKISISESQKHAIKIIKEISANFSYEAIRLSDRILGWIWKRLYQQLKINNIEIIHKLAKEGMEIVYIPCHRSHIDYLLLSYVLYNQGLMPPHIAAGINLNFWPMGFILRRLGAFFIRRTFKSNKLYSIIFREYLNELFMRRHSVEYFIEGGRSRTGRLLKPKTGTLSMTIQAMLRKGMQPIILVPIYIGYEDIIEIASYIKEYHNFFKKKHGFWYILYRILKLRHLGNSYINFGDPLSLTSWLSHKVPQWYHSIFPIECKPYRPIWLGQITNDIANHIMIRINNAAAVNAINLCSIILLASYKYSLSRTQLLSQLSCYLNLLNNVPYSPNITIPKLTAEKLLERALIIHKLNMKNEIIFLSTSQANLMMYYRNNIQHLLVLPALIANILCIYIKITDSQLKKYILLLYPIFKADFFIHYEKSELSIIIDNIISEFLYQNLITKHTFFICISQSKLNNLKLLAACINETLYRYAIIFSLLRINYQFDLKKLNKKSQIIANQLALLYKMNVNEFFDKTTLYSIVTILRIDQNINDKKYFPNEQIDKIWNILIKLISPNIINIIEYYSL